MESKDVAFRVVEESDDLIYVSDIDTYELLYLNKAARDTFDVNERDYKGSLCYQMLQNLDAPCPFCTNHLLKTDSFYVWKHYNDLLLKHYSLKDKMVEFEGRRCRMEICTDMTESVLSHQELKIKLSTEETLVSCIHTLSECEDVEDALNKLLIIIGVFYGAERAYIFEFDFERDLLSNSYEWCKRGVKPQIDNLKELPSNAADRWVEQFKKSGEFYITSVGKTLSQDSIEYKILKPQGIESLMAAPLWEAGRVAGFIGVDNPTRGQENIRLLRSITYFIKNDIDKRKLIDNLQKLSFKDGLTGLGNRNNYIETIERMVEEPPESLGVIFIDINGLKKANDELGHEYGDYMILGVAKGMLKYFPEYSFRIGGDEFVALYVNGTEEEFQNRIQQMKEYEKETCICDFSMGIDFRKGDVDVSGQISKCDSMMYAEKKSYYEMSTKNRRNRDRRN